MHTCPKCGFYPLPTPASEPVIDRLYNKWRVLCWTEGSYHRWIPEHDTEEAAEKECAALRTKFYADLPGRMA